jgi:serine protease Do
MTVNATIDKRDEKVAQSDGNYFPGIIVVSLKAEGLNSDKLPKDAKGVYVVNVSDKSPGSIVGLKAGDIITEVNEKPISNVREFYRQLNDTAAKKIAFTVLRDGQTITTLAYVKK